MIRGSILVAIAAFLLSLLVHGLGLNVTSPKERTQLTDEGAPDLADVGGAFEDFAEALAEPGAPEPAEAPAPPGVTSPEPVVEDTPTSQALVASDNPQNVTAPDTGDGDVTEPEAAELPESGAPETDPAEPSGGQDDTVADAAAAQATEPVTAAEPPDGKPDGSPESSETVEARAPSIEALSPVPPTPEVSPSPEISPAPEALQPDLPDISVASVPDAPEILTAEGEEAASSSAVTRSLRPPKERPSAEALGVPDRTQQRSAQRGSSQGVIESPLTAYRRSGVDLLALGGGGVASGSTGFSGSRGPGNAGATNYVGQVLVQLNRSPVLYASAQGTARVSFQINPDGTLAWVRVLSSRGSRDIERAARAQVQSAAPFPRPPTGTSQRLVFVYQNR